MSTLIVNSTINLKEENENFLEKFDLVQVKSMQEMCIAVDENDNPIAARSKKDCHLMVNINKGLLHRAFSVLIFNSKGDFLLTQRSDTKITFPGYYTNACCSHPLHNELEMETKDAIGVRRAAQRRLSIELGIEPLEMPLNELEYMTRILYRAPSGGEWGEAEIDYVLIVKKDLKLNPNKDEIKSYHYLSKEQLKPFIEKVESEGEKVSPWFKVMVNEFLFDWWNNLDNLKKLKDHRNIHRF